MKTVEYYLNESEKVIFTDYFHEKNSSKKPFLNWLDDFLAFHRLNRIKDDTQLYYSDDIEFKIMVEDKTIFQYLLGLPIEISTNRFRNLLRFNPDLSVTDAKGDTLLHLSCYMKEHYFKTYWFISNHDFLSHKINQNGESYHTLFLNNFDPKLLINPPAQKDNDFINLMTQNVIIERLALDYCDSKPMVSSGVEKRFIEQFSQLVINFENFTTIIYKDKRYGFVDDAYKDNLKNLQSCQRFLELSQIEDKKEIIKRIKV